MTIMSLIAVKSLHQTARIDLLLKALKRPASWIVK